MFLSILSSLLVAGGCPAHQEALIAAADAVEQTYVTADEGREIAAELRRWAANGRHPQACDDAAGFMAQLNRELDVFDGHFFFERPADGPEAAAEDWLTAWRAEAPKVNAGLREVRVLEGNIGYIRISSWYPWEIAGPKFHAALALTAEVDGLIIDVRGNGGGDAVTPAHLLGALAGPEVVAVQAIARRNGEELEPLPEPELPRIDPDLPVAVLIDRRSASASEYLAYSLQALGRATLVGSRSGGVASMIGEPTPLPHGFAIAIPDARPVNLTTGGSWEGSGAKPDLPGGDDPLHVARRHLESLRR
jgi:carboxyl-terminal processing protease